MSEAKLLPFTHTAEPQASRWQIWRGRLKESFCRVLDRLHVPGIVRNLDYHDQVTGQYIRVRAGHLFTVISVNGRDYYFNRLSGRFDGTGMGCG